MADIVDPTVIKFVSEQIRPLSEQTRALKARITSLTTDWFSGLNAKVPNDPASIVQDGRTAEGVSELSGADVNSVVGDLIAAAAAVNDQIIGKPCVRPLQVTTPGA